MTDAMSSAIALTASSRLCAALEAAVPLRIREIRQSGMPWDVIQQRAAECAQAIGWPGRTPHLMARGFRANSFQPRKIHPLESSPRVPGFSRCFAAVGERSGRDALARPPPVRPGS